MATEHVSKSTGATSKLAGSLHFPYVVSLVLAVLQVASALIGLISPATTYPSEALQQAFLANDIVNLVIGVPILLGAMWLARRGRLAGLLLWSGALFFLFYNAIVYVFAMPLDVVFVLYLGMLSLSTYGLAGLLAAMDGSDIRGRLAGKVPERLAGGLLTALGMLFLARVLIVLIAAILEGTTIADTEMALHIADFVIAPAFILGGTLLWRRKGLGYVAGLGLLFQVSMLFIGLIIVLLIQPLLTTAELSVLDVAVVAAMGLICFVPFGLFVRAAWSNQE
jgi:hypothetical protein